MSVLKLRSVMNLTAFAIVAMILSVAAASAADDVSVRFSWKMKGEYAHFFLAKESGFYEENGLNVTLGEGAGAQAALGALLQGQDDLVVMPGVFALSAIQKGIPVKMVALYQPRAPVVFISYPENPITRPKDLEGKSIVTSVGETGTSYLGPFCEINNVDCSRINKILVDRNARVAQFVQGQVDSVNVYRSNDLPIIQKKTGIEYGVLDMSEYGYAAPGMAVVTSEKNLRGRPDVLKRFLAATARGIQTTRADVKQATRAIKASWRNSPDDDVIDAQVQATMESIPELKGRPIGWVSEKAIQEALGFLKTNPDFGEPKPASSYYSNSLFQ